MALGNGDLVGVAEAWDWPDTFDGVKPADLRAVQTAIRARCEAGAAPRFSDQSGDDWAGVVVAEVLDLDAVADTLQRQGDKVAAVILEPVDFNSGGIPPLPGYLEGLRELTRKHGALLFFDESR